MNALTLRLKAVAGRLNARLSTGQKVSFALLFAILVAAIGTLTWYGTKQEYRVLASELSAEDAGKVRDALEKDKIPFELAGDGTAIRVPADAETYGKAVLAVSSSGMTGGIVGNELFDKANLFGMPQEVLELNQRRAQEGELARTIQSFDEVKSARVHLALPDEALFANDQKPPTASVVVNLEPGATLSPRQVKGITGLIASSITGLDAADVTVVDQTGKVLSQPQDDFLGGGTATALEYQKNVERDLEQKATEVLERFVGAGKAVVRVRAKMDFSREERKETLYDGDKAVPRSEETLTEERQNGGGQVGGAAGAEANTGAGPGMQRVGDASNSTREKSVVNYEINKVEKHVMQGPGARVERLSVAVIVDGVYKPLAPPAEGAEEGAAAPAPEYAGRSEQEMATIRNLVAKAIEFSEKRGDEIEVANVQFQQEPVADPTVAAGVERSALIEKGVRYGLTLVVALLLIFVVFRPLVRWLTAPVAETEAEALAQGALPAPEEALALPGEDVVKQLEAPEDSILDKIREFAKQNPEVASSVVRYWLKSR